MQKAAAVLVIWACLLVLGAGRGDDKGAAPGVLGEGPGLSAKYPGDAGIERDPAVIFAENFAEGTVRDLSKRWQTVSNKDDVVLAFSKDVPEGAATGTSLEVTGTLEKNSGGYLYTSFPGVDQAFLRFYTRFAPDHGYEHHFVEMGGYNPAQAWPHPHPGQCPAGDDRMLVFVDALGWNGKYPPPGVWGLYAFWAEMKISADGEYWGNGMSPVAPAPVPRGRWQCVELMIRMNSAPDRRDGELALWTDGKLVLHVARGVPRSEWSGMGFTVLKDGGTPFEGLRLRTDQALKINHLWLEHYVDKGAQEANRLKDPNSVNRVWFSNIVVSREYVGPIQPPGPRPAAKP